MGIIEVTLSSKNYFTAKVKKVFHLKCNQFEVLP